MSHEHHHHHDTHAVQHLYDGAAGRDYVASEFFREKLLFGGLMRKRIFSKASGNILDVACGSGDNFQYYQRPGNTYTAIELSPVMLQGAAARARKLNMEVDLRVMDAEHLDFADAQFDTVVSAMSTCTFPDPIAALQEMRRVVKPTGRILLFEHGRSSWNLIARWQDNTAEQMYRVAGCRANQEPLELVKAAGLTVVQSERNLLGIFHLLEVSPS